MKVIFIILSIVWVVYLLLRTKKAIHMLQLNSYFNNRLFHWMKGSPLKVVPVKDIIIIILALICMLFDWYIVILAILAIGILTHREKPEKKKLVITARVKRLMATIAIIYIVILAVNLHFVWHEETYRIGTLVMVLATIFVYGIVLVANLVNRPIENGIKERYYKDARNRMNSARQTTTVGITGSFGKTSTKFALDTILSTHLNTLKTPNSYNTKIGVTITIRNSLKPYHDVFIAEMGAKEPGNIQEICELVGHKYAILTAIGEQHLETFKTLDTIKKTKFEIVETLPPDGVVFLNGDDENIMSYTPQNNCRKVYFGIENNDADFIATNIQFHHKGTTFHVKNKDGSLDADFETKLLGKHNVYNILAAISVAWEMEVPLNKIQQGVKKIQAVPHRMEIKKGFGNLTVIDDSFNSNPTGSKMALEVLSSMEGFKVLVTPGMVELGDKEYDYNKAFGTYAADSADYVILVGEKQTKPIQDGLREKGYPEDQLFIAKDLNHAIEQIKTFNRPDAIILLENDLPDTYNE
ncbi:UDP-N-acetylmuramoyl-tripeptide--D-alanyl-D-alanine ligase [Gracilibacillus halotolerans]|uniref:UDP-N-acetylmuramoyl-tripeptide--D-alanyl-D-alanine ligase n=1 Tax=Gracilibacillus halotolerans TaxID=74386 RepID=A0A841RMT4_9BACI|nr:UDP-N-acetylmuramoyl-tripeptide--D-alanyl-D-alanine ligase [Gracilibacillus halotolerans]MBB6513202.1 UDP-N-acetylmuramoyl-tripeptide--D-alanyl-D-alanine ligase [Gracilibacillus halotolerans]